MSKLYFPGPRNMLVYVAKVAGGIKVANQLTLTQGGYPSSPRWKRRQGGRRQGDEMWEKLHQLQAKVRSRL